MLGRSVVSLSLVLGVCLPVQCCGCPVELALQLSVHLCHNLYICTRLLYCVIIYPMTGDGSLRSKFWSMGRGGNGLNLCTVSVCMCKYK